MCPGGQKAPANQRRKVGRAQTDSQCEFSGSTGFSSLSTGYEVGGRSYWVGGHRF